MGNMTDGCQFPELQPGKRKLLFTVGVCPVFQQTACDVGHTGVPAFAPNSYPLPDAVDVFVFFDPVLGPLGVKFELLPLLFGSGYRDEIGADSSRIDDHVGDPLIIELKVTSRLPERRVQDRVVDNNVSHGIDSICSQFRGLA